MSKLSKKFNAKEQEKLAQELIAADLDLDILGPSKKPRKSLKPPIEKLKNYKLIVGDSVFWASRPAYLEVLQSFLSKKIDEKTLTSKFFELRVEDLISIDELCARIEDQTLPIPELYYTFKAKDFRSAINDLYLEIDQYDPNIDDWDWNDIVYSESQLRSGIREKFVPRFQQSCILTTNLMSRTKLIYFKEITKC